MEGQLATEDMRSQEVPYEILSVNSVVEILDKVFKLAFIYTRRLVGSTNQADPCSEFHEY